MVERFDKALDTDETLSEDDIPCSLAISVKDDPFEYSVCEEIAKVNLPRFVRPLIPSGNWYERDKQRVYNLDFEIAALIIQKNEYLKQKTL